MAYDALLLNVLALLSFSREACKSKLASWWRNRERLRAHRARGTMRAPIERCAGLTCAAST